MTQVFSHTPRYQISRTLVISCKVPHFEVLLDLFSSVPITCVLVQFATLFVYIADEPQHLNCDASVKD